ncbi:hypothetical protein, conserved [Entamoeba dispar SAW760]|uniref:Uncharacterized protein n=1 Tax=Entamoeba dispar (strain ATCC PRA-260 / SAW760) TaxID=370354 RepID=B0E5Q3_ENTDS|nr:uncharacterized protein EDI_013690 [Entamoeba dispar SAW760]EDR30149.1 hypothetical protein, conserved [Entamoeba dispar SAW760]|eukprot:EDR30149.1 hypothetical protein, conserved [Entamoeba dispar SAW760]
MVLLETVCLSEVATYISDMSVMMLFECVSKRCEQIVCLMKRCPPLNNLHSVSSFIKKNNVKVISADGLMFCPELFKKVDFIEKLSSGIVTQILEKNMVSNKNETDIFNELFPRIVSLRECDNSFLQKFLLFDFHLKSIEGSLSFLQMFVHLFQFLNIKKNKFPSVVYVLLVSSVDLELNEETLQPIFNIKSQYNSKVILKIRELKRWESIKNVPFDIVEVTNGPFNDIENIKAQICIPHNFYFYNDDFSTNKRGKKVNQIINDCGIIKLNFNTLEKEEETKSCMSVKNWILPNCVQTIVLHNGSEETIFNMDNVHCIEFKNYEHPVIHSNWIYLSELKFKNRKHFFNSTRSAEETIYFLDDVTQEKYTLYDPSPIINTFLPSLTNIFIKDISGINIPEFKSLKKMKVLNCNNINCNNLNSLESLKVIQCNECTFNLLENQLKKVIVSSSHSCWYDLLIKLSAILSFDCCEKIVLSVNQKEENKITLKINNCQGISIFNTNPQYKSVEVTSYSFVIFQNTKTCIDKFVVDNSSMASKTFFTIQEYLEITNISHMLSFDCLAQKVSISNISKMKFNNCFPNIKELVLRQCDNCSFILSLNNLKNFNMSQCNKTSFECNGIEGSIIDTELIQNKECNLKIITSQLNIKKFLGNKEISINPECLIRIKEIMIEDSENIKLNLIQSLLERVTINNSLSIEISGNVKKENQIISLNLNNCQRCLFNIEKQNILIEVLKNSSEILFTNETNFYGEVLEIIRCQKIKLEFKRNSFKDVILKQCNDIIIKGNKNENIILTNYNIISCINCEINLKNNNCNLVNANTCDECTFNFVLNKQSVICFININNSICELKGSETKIIKVIRCFHSDFKGKINKVERVICCLNEMVELPKFNDNTKIEFKEEEEIIELNKTKNIKLNDDQYQLVIQNGDEKICSLSTKECISLKLDNVIDSTFDLSQSHISEFTMINCSNDTLKGNSGLVLMNTSRIIIINSIYQYIYLDKESINDITIENSEISLLLIENKIKSKTCNTNHKLNPNIVFIQNLILKNGTIRKLLEYPELQIIIEKVEIDGNFGSSFDMLSVLPKVTKNLLILNIQIVVIEMNSEILEVLEITKAKTVELKYFNPKKQKIILNKCKKVTIYSNETINILQERIESIECEDIQFFKNEWEVQRYIKSK